MAEFKMFKSTKKIKQQAEKIYKKELQKMIKLVGNKTTFSDKLDKVAIKLFGNRFMGVFPNDKIPKNIKMGYFLIANLDNSNEPGSHWVGIIKEKDIIWVYDSFGRNIHKIMPGIYGKRRKIKSTERDAEQHKKEENCGARVLAFLSVFNKHGIKYAKYI